MMLQIDGTTTYYADLYKVETGKRHLLFLRLRQG